MLVLDVRKLCDQWHKGDIERERNVLTLLLLWDHNENHVLKNDKPFFPVEIEM